MKGVHEFASVPQRRFRRQGAREIQRFVAKVAAPPTLVALRSRKSREYCPRIRSGRFVPSWQTLADLTASAGYEIAIPSTKKRRT